MKIEAIKNEAGRFYVQIWLNALHELLGWTKEQTLNWAEKWENDLNNPDCLFFHEPPLYYILNLLIPKKLEEKCSGELPKLKRVLLLVIENTASFDRYQNPKFDWKLAKQRIETFLRKVEHKSGPMDAFLIEYQKQISGNK